MTTCKILLGQWTQVDAHAMAWAGIVKDWRHYMSNQTAVMVCFNREWMALDLHIFGYAWNMSMDMVYVYTPSHMEGIQYTVKMMCHIL